MVTHRSDSEPRERLDLRRVAMEAEEETRRLGDTTQPPPVLDLPDDEVMIDGDRFSLREAVKNLINNAQTHGRLPITIRVRSADDRALVSVIDGGAGLPENLRDTAGARFHSGAAPSRKGAGLGLAIVHDVAQSHHGSMEFTDLPGGGFEISIALPLADAP